MNMIKQDLQTSQNNTEVQRLLCQHHSQSKSSGGESQKTSKMYFEGLVLN